METRTTWSICLLVLLFAIGSAEVVDNGSKQGEEISEEDLQKAAEELKISRTAALQSSEELEYNNGYLGSPVQNSYVSAAQGYSPLQGGYLHHNHPPTSVQQGYQQPAEYHLEYMVQESPLRHYEPNYVQPVQPSYVPSVQPHYVPSVQPHYSPQVEPIVLEPHTYIEVQEPHTQPQPILYAPSAQPNFAPSGYPQNSQTGYISTATESERIHELLEERHRKQQEYGQNMQANYGNLLPVQPNYVQPSYNNQPSVAVAELEILHEYQEMQPQHIHVPHQPSAPVIQPALLQPSYVPTVQPEVYITPQPHYNTVVETQVYARLIPVEEYIWPHREQGSENVIICQREGELHNFRSPIYDCLVCTCINEGLVLEPICARCSTCALQPQPQPSNIIISPVPIPMPTPVPVPVPDPVPEPVNPEIVTVTCSPMPSGTPFQNPLNPCQVCICFESVTIYGQPDVKIECQENAQCVVPDIVPVIPDTPQPVPLPVCQQFPTNVLFPHPQEACKLCRCTVQATAYGVLQDVIDCFPDTQCASTPIPVPQPIPTSIPEIIVIPEPIRPPAPPAPIGPLPGPSPHESCRPYSPNQPFQHPWDECQVCICTEAYNVGRVSIEVNCFTKKSCCIELPFEAATITAIPPLQVTTPSISPFGPINPYYIPQEQEVMPVPIPNRIHPYGQYKPGQLFSGQIISEQIFPGQMIPGQVTPGQVIPGQMIPGQVIQGQVIPGQMTPGQVIPGQIYPGQVIPGSYVPGEYISGQVISEMSPGSVNQYIPGQYTPGQLISGEMISGQITPGQMTTAEIISGTLLPNPASNYPSSQYSTGLLPTPQNYGGGNSWSASSESSFNYQEKEIESSSASSSSGYNQFSGNQNYFPVFKGLATTPKSIPGLHGLNLNQRPSHVYSNYGYDISPSGGSYSAPSYIVEEYPGQAGMGQQGLISGQPGLISGQQHGLISGPPGLISGQPLISSQGFISSGPSYATGYNPFMYNQGYVMGSKKFKTKSADPDLNSSEETK